jgi:hypothetical protein
MLHRPSNILSTSDTADDSNSLPYTKQITTDGQAPAFDKFSGKTSVLEFEHRHRRARSNPGLLSLRGFGYVMLMIFVALD